MPTSPTVHQSVHVLILKIYIYIWNCICYLEKKLSFLYLVKTPNKEQPSDFFNIFKCCNIKLINEGHQTSFE